MEESLTLVRNNLMYYHTKHIILAKIMKNFIYECMIVSFQASSKYVWKQAIKPGRPSESKNSQHV